MEGLLDEKRPNSGLGNVGEFRGSEGEAPQIGTVLGGGEERKEEWRWGMGKVNSGRPYQNVGLVWAYCLSLRTSSCPLQVQALGGCLLWDVWWPGHLCSQSCAWQRWERLHFWGESGPRNRSVCSDIQTETRLLAQKLCENFIPHLESSIMNVQDGRSA